MKCSTLFRAVSVTAISASLLGPVLARQGTKMDPNAKTMTIEGLVRDLACPFRLLGEKNGQAASVSFDVMRVRRH